MLNADELGEKGQSHFKEICADAKLICNQADRDRAGWDFIVEFPFENTASSSVTLETRLTPLSCHVQVKTLLERNDRFGMRLSSAERLAKELKPAFIYVFKVNEANEFADSYLIHVLDDSLAAILKRLRKESASGQSSSNKKKISMSASANGDRMPPTGEALRGALVASVGNDLSVYARKKTNQIETLGFEERPFITEMTLQIEENNDIADIFLGLKRDVPVKNVRGAHTRFGIEVPLPELTDKDALITIEPSVADLCTITFRGTPLEQTEVFRGKVFYPIIGGLPVAQRKILLKTDFFNVIVMPDRVKIKNALARLRHTPSAWASYCRLAHILATGGSVMKIISDNRSIDFERRFAAGLPELNADRCKLLAELSTHAAALLKHIGIANEPEVNFEQLVGSAERVEMLYGLIFGAGKSEKLSFTSALPETISDGPLEFQAIYAEYFELAGVPVGYYGSMQLLGLRSGDALNWQSDCLALRKVMELRSIPDDFEKMIEEAQKETGFSAVIRASPPLTTK